MPTATKDANANAPVITGWTNPTNAYGDNGVYATALPAKNTQVSSDFGFPAFSTADIPDGSTIVSVQVEAQYKSSTTGSAGATFALRTINNTTALGTITSVGMTLADAVATQTVTSGVTLADLRQANVVKARVAGLRAGSNTAITWSVDYVRITVTYTEPPPAVSGTGGITGQRGALAGTGSEAFAGAGALTTRPATLTGSGDVAEPAGASGAAAVTLSSVTLEAAGLETIAGAGALAADPVALEGSGVEGMDGAGVIVGQYATLAATGAVTIAGAGGAVFQPATVGGSDVEPITGDGELMLEPFAVFLVAVEGVVNEPQAIQAAPGRTGGTARSRRRWKPTVFMPVTTHLVGAIGAGFFAGRAVRAVASGMVTPPRAAKESMMVATLNRPKTKRPLKGTKMLGVVPGKVEFKLLDEPGAFRATFALFNVKDLDRDVTLPGAFKVGAAVRIAQWGHNWGQPAIGKGVIGADGERAWVDGQFNLNMTAGKETYEAVKALGDLQQWSYGFDIDKWSVGKFEDEEVRFLEAMTVHEISPVMLGAQPLTSTDQIKTQKVGRRNSAADEEAMRSALDALTSAADALRQILGDEDDDDEEDTDADEENEDGKASKRGKRKGERETLAARLAIELLEMAD